MKQSGADEGAVYDDDAAFDYMHEQMSAQFSEHKMYMLRLVEDYRTTTSATSTASGSSTGNNSTIWNGGERDFPPALLFRTEFLESVAENSEKKQKFSCLH
jgi:hypothetical protein